MIEPAGTLQPRPLLATVPLRRHSPCPSLIGRYPERRRVHESYRSGQAADNRPCRLRLPNDWRISCRPSGPDPHKPTLPLLVPPEGAARAEAGAIAACRLHARVRRQGPRDARLRYSSNRELRMALELTAVFRKVPEGYVAF